MIRCGATSSAKLFELQGEEWAECRSLVRLDLVAWRVHLRLPTERGHHVRIECGGSGKGLVRSR